MHYFGRAMKATKVRIFESAYTPKEKESMEMVKRLIELALRFPKIYHTLLERFEALSS